MMFKKLLDGLAAIQTYISGTLFLVIFSINTMEIISRTFFNHSFLWVTDISTICIVWMIMLGMAVGVYQKEHIVLDLLISRFPHRLRHVVTVVITLLTFAFFCHAVCHRRGDGGNQTDADFSHHPVVHDLGLLRPSGVFPVRCGLYDPGSNRALPGQRDLQGVGRRGRSLPMSLYTKETDSQRVVFDEYRFIPLLDQENGCQAGCRCGILEYTQLDYLQGGTHEDQEVFFVLSGTGLAVVGDQEIPLSPGVCFVAPPGRYHSIKRDQTVPCVRLFFFHAAV